MWTVVAIVLILWLFGWNFNIGHLGGSIHLLLVVAIVLAVFSLFRGRPAA